MKLVVASNNPGKLREFGALLAPLGWGSPLAVLDELEFAGKPALRALPVGERHAGAVQLAVRPGVADLEPTSGLYDGAEASVLRLGLPPSSRQSSREFPAGNLWGTFCGQIGPLGTLSHFSGQAYC